MPGHQKFTFQEIERRRGEIKALRDSLNQNPALQVEAAILASNKPNLRYESYWDVEYVAVDHNSSSMLSKAATGASIGSALGFLGVLAGAAIGVAAYNLNVIDEPRDVRKQRLTEASRVAQSLYDSASDRLKEKWAAYRGGGQVPPTQNSTANSRFDPLINVFTEKGL